MDDQAKYEALKSEYEAVPAQLVGPERAEVVYLRVFRDKGGLVRLDVSTENEDDRLQLVVGAASLMSRITDPQ